MIYISVLVPIYNVEEYIIKCVESLLNNTIANKCEFIFVNDCSTDNSYIILKQIIKNFPDLKQNVKLIEHPINKGLAATRNTGLLNASGKYIICVDSDDWVEPDYLECLYKKAEENDADVTGCNFIFEGNNITKKCLPLTENKTYNIQKFLDDSIPAYVWNKLIKRNLFTENNIFWVEGIDMFEDFQIMIQIFLVANKFSMVDKSLYHYVYRQNSISSSKQIKNWSNIFYAIEVAKKCLLDNKKYDEYKDYLLRKILNLKFAFCSFYVPIKVKDYKLVFTLHELNFYKNQKDYMTIKKRIIIFLFKRNFYLILKGLYLFKSLFRIKYIDYNLFKKEFHI